MNRKVDSMIIGADRSGSTWLRYLCSENPEVYVCPVWQREFLSKKMVSRHRFYRPMKFNCPLDDYDGEKIVLGVRNMALYHSNKVAKLYFSHNKKMRFLLSLRNPIDRTFSQFMVRNLLIQENGGIPTFNINEKLNAREPHVKRTMVYTLIKPYLDLFPKNQFYIYPMELMKKDTLYWLEKLYTFLEVPIKTPKSLKDLNKTANPGRYNKSDFVPMSEDSKRLLLGMCLSEIEGLSDLSKIDLLEVWDLKKYL